MFNVWLSDMVAGEMEVAGGDWRVNGYVGVFGLQCRSTPCVVCACGQHRRLQREDDS